MRLHHTNFTHFSKNFFHFCITLLSCDTFISHPFKLFCILQIFTLNIRTFTITYTIYRVICVDFFFIRLTFYIYSLNGYYFIRFFLFSNFSPSLYSFYFTLPGCIQIIQSSFVTSLVFYPTIKRHYFMFSDFALLYVTKGPSFLSVHFIYRLNSF